MTEERHPSYDSDSTVFSWKFTIAYLLDMFYNEGIKFRREKR